MRHLRGVVIVAAIVLPSIVLPSVLLPSVSWADDAKMRSQDSKKKSEKPRFFMRAAILHMAPNVSSDEVALSNLSEFAQLAIDSGPIAGSGVGVDSVTIPALLVGYVLPYLDGHLSIETILGAPVELTLKATGTLASESIAPFALGNVPTGVPAVGADLGSAKAIPPIVTAVYRFDPWHRLRPYAGGGLGYMHVYDAQITNPVLSEVAPPVLEVSDAVGLVLQAGVETRLQGRYFATFDVKAIVGMSMEATVRDIYIRTPDLPVFEMAHAGDATVDIGLTPIIVSGGVGAEF